MIYWLPQWISFLFSGRSHLNNSVYNKKLDMKMQNETKNERISFKIKTSMKTKIVLDFFKINISLV